MKVKDLIEKLKHIDGDLELLCYTEDEGLVEGGEHFRLLDIERVDVSEASTTRKGTGVVGFAFGRGDESRTFAFLHVSAQF